ncbi:MAG: GAK system XXXCH domain-containing protein [Desulfobacterales bacterium]|nr:MAG: GAK system XXXCH domain-containing protein [Desulfobacterales bacterium]
MEKKIEKKFSRLELAGHLEKIAVQLRSGTFEADGRQWTIPDAFEAKIKHKEKKGRIETKLKWRWSTLSDYAPSAREAVTRWQESFKRIKKRLAKEFKALQSAVAEGNFPADDALAEFVRDSKRMAEFAEPEWQNAMNEYLDHLANLQRAVNQKQLEVIEHELRDLSNRWMACHRDFK